MPNVYNEAPFQSCCPVVLAEGCWNDGVDSGTWVSIRDDEGNPSLIDPTTGNIIDSDDVVECPPTSCCPVVLAEGCWDDGVDSGTWVSIRDEDGNPSVIDPVTGNTVSPADVVDCGIVQVNSRHKDVVDGDPWTPADQGLPVLTALTYTVVVGLADVVDFNGTAITSIPVGYTNTWENNNESTLGAPQSITAPNPGDRIIVAWTERSA